MMKLFLLAVLLGAAPLAGASDAPVPAPAATRYAVQSDGSVMEVPAEATPAASNDEDKMVCVRQKKLGTNMSERVCTTKGERQAAKDRARAEFERAQR